MAYGMGDLAHDKRLEELRRLSREVCRDHIAMQIAQTRAEEAVKRLLFDLARDCEVKMPDFHFRASMLLDDTIAACRLIQKNAEHWHHDRIEAVITILRAGRT